MTKKKERPAKPGPKTEKKVKVESKRKSTGAKSGYFSENDDDSDFFQTLLTKEGLGRTAAIRRMREEFVKKQQSDDLKLALSSLLKGHFDGVHAKLDQIVIAAPPSDLAPVATFPIEAGPLSGFMMLIELAELVRQKVRENNERYIFSYWDVAVNSILASQESIDYQKIYRTCELFFSKVDPAFFEQNYSLDTFSIFEDARFVLHTIRAAVNPPLLTFYDACYNPIETHPRILGHDLSADMAELRSFIQAKYTTTEVTHPHQLAGEELT